MHTVDAGAVKTETEMESQALGSPSTLVQSPGAIMETSPTPLQLTGMFALMLCVPSNGSAHMRLGDSEYVHVFPQVEDFVVLRCVGRQQW